MKLCLACSAEWPKKKRNEIKEPEFCACGSKLYRDVAPLDSRIAPGSTISFEKQRELWEQERRGKSQRLASSVDPANGAT